jgi:hypothetical protein
LFKRLIREQLKERRKETKKKKKKKRKKAKKRKAKTGTAFLAARLRSALLSSSKSPVIVGLLPFASSSKTAAKRIQPTSTKSGRLKFTAKSFDKFFKLLHDPKHSTIVDLAELLQALANMSSLFQEIAGDDNLSAKDRQRFAEGLPGLLKFVPRASHWS